jgi:hypothetical protein
MLKMKATKTSLYKLVSKYTDLPGMRRVEFIKAPRRPDYWLDWITADGYNAKAFFSTIMGRPLLSITIRDENGNQLFYKTYQQTIGDLLERGLVREVG